MKYSIVTFGCRVNQADSLGFEEELQAAGAMVVPAEQADLVIVNTCSVVATVGLVERAVYSASKGAVLALTRAMAADEVRHQIRVNCVSPGTVASPWVERLVAESPAPGASHEALRRRQPAGSIRGSEPKRRPRSASASPLWTRRGQWSSRPAGSPAVTKPPSRTSSPVT